MSAGGRMPRVVAGFATMLLLAGFPAPSGAPPVIFTVTTTVDAPDAAPGDGLCATAAAACSLRAALAEAATTGVTAEITVPAGHYVVADARRPSSTPTARDGCSTSAAAPPSSSPISR